MRLLMAVLAVTWPAIGVLAENPAPMPARVWMSEPELRNTFSDKTIQGNYSNGKAFRETYRADGSIDYSEHEVAYRGHWSLQAGSFCTIYQTDPTGGCFHVRQVSVNCYEFYFVSRTEAQAAEGDLRRPAWTARAATSDRDATCEDKPTV